MNMTKVTYNHDYINSHPPKEWFVLNELFGSEYIPFWRVLEVADQIFDSYEFYNPQVLFVNDLYTVTIELKVEWAYPFKRSSGTASRLIPRRGAVYNNVSAATVPAIVLSIAKKNAMQKFCNLLGRLKDIPDEDLEIKPENNFIN